MAAMDYFLWPIEACQKSGNAIISVKLDPSQLSQCLLVEDDLKLETCSCFLGLGNDLFCGTVYIHLAVVLLVVVLLCYVCACTRVSCAVYMCILVNDPRCCGMVF